jgi:hypothetical protein
MATIFGSNDPPSNPYLRGGQLTRGELANRNIGAARLASNLRFVNIVHIVSRTTLYHTDPSIFPLVGALGLNSFDASALTGDTDAHRKLTQQVALSIYKKVDAQGRRLFDGIRYESHVNTDWECWAVFYECLQYTPVSVTAVDPTDPSLIRAMSALNVQII